MNALFVVLTTFLAAAVEAVEMMTIVLGVGITRGWRSTLIGCAAGGLVLAAIVATLGPALTFIPIDVLRAVIGILLLLFGLQWLRQAIYRGAERGFRPKPKASTIPAPAANAVLADPAASSGPTAAAPWTAGMDWTAFALSFKGVVLEGLEVAFIVVSFGATTGQLGLSVVGAVAALALVAVAGGLAHRVLRQVPETALKLAVGLLLAGYGTFWGAEGLGVAWPGDDAAVLGLMALYIAASYLYFLVLRRALRSGAADGRQHGGIRRTGGQGGPASSDRRAA